MTTQNQGRSVAILSCVGVFVAALAGRFVLVSELRDESYLGNIRVSDARTYFQLAQQIVAGTAPFEPYWQAPLYPLLLSVFQAAFGNSLHSAQWPHLLIGALNCALLFHLSNALFGKRAAWWAAAIAVLYAPFMLFDVQPLPANLTVLLDLVLVSVYLRFPEQGGLLTLAIAGVVLGLTIITHGLAIFTLPVFLYDLATRQGQSTSSTNRRAACLAVLLAATALAPTAVSIRNSLAAGTPVFISYNSGINLYVGNHRDLEQTLGRRGGYEWGELFRAPYTSGVKEPAALNRYFVEHAIDEWLDAPIDTTLTLGAKALMSVSAAEPKRNFPIYPLREDALVLKLLMFEVNAFGITFFAFPAGIVIPLSILGFWGICRRERDANAGLSSAAIPGWVACFHVLGMLVFFPTARYRVPALMLLLPYAGVAAVWLWDRFSKRTSDASVERRAAFASPVAILLVFLLVNPVASNVFRHPTEDRAEHLYFMALWAGQKLQYVRSASLEAEMVANASESMRIDPSYPEPVQLLAVYHVNGDIERSLALFAKLEGLVPNDEDVRSLARAAQAVRDEQLRTEADAVSEPSAASEK